MQTEPPTAAPPKRKRRWFQFSVRTLMIFAVLCAIGSAWLGKKIERKRKEREAVDGDAPTSPSQSRLRLIRVNRATYCDCTT